jgi:predicted phosphoribosyltransferase/pimeloyl-ACP methyl ester carboxylesterase
MTINKNERKVLVSNERLEGDLVIPENARAIIIFAHGSGSNRYSTRNRYVAKALNDAGFATLLIDLLTPEEKIIDEKDKHLRFDIDLLASRFLLATRWVLQDPETSRLSIGYFGSSTGVAAALMAAAELGGAVKTIVGRGGRPDLADFRGVLHRITVPVLFIVGSNDNPVVALSKAAIKQLPNAEAKELAIIPDAGHLFEESGRMEEVAIVSTEWFNCFLLRSGKKFENTYKENTRGLFSFLKEKPHMQLRFKDRTAAGNILASSLGKYKNNNASDIVVIGIPRGGIVVAKAIAEKFDADFDIVVPRKLRAPDNSENAIGAIMQDDSVYIREHPREVSKEYLEQEKLEQKKEIERRLALYRPRSQKYEIRDKVVILVDDGAATGATIIAAARWIRNQKPKRLIIAVPVASYQAKQLLKKEADDLEIIRCPSDFKTVESFYQDYSPVGDQQVIEILHEAESIKKKSDTSE